MDLLQRLADFLGASRYAAHSICLTNDPVVVGLFELADLTITASYYVIGGILLAQIRTVVQFIWFVTTRRWALYLFGAFIVLCGTSHAVMVLTLHFGVYYLDVLVRLVTAIVSAGTAIMTALAFYAPMSRPEFDMLHRFMALLEGMLALKPGIPGYDPRPLDLPNEHLRPRSDQP